MDRVTRCLQCGKSMVPARSLTGRTALICIYCDKLDPLEMEEAKKSAESPLANPFTRKSLKRSVLQQAWTNREENYGAPCRLLS